MEESILSDHSFTLSMNEVLQRETRRKTENTYKDAYIENLISEITFLKDEILYLREDGKRKSDEILLLLKLLQKTKIIINTDMDIEKPQHTTLNKNAENLDSSRNVNELSTSMNINESQNILNSTINGDLTNDSKNNVIIEETIMENTNINLEHINDNRVTFNEQIEVIVENTNINVEHIPINEQIEMIRKDEHRKFLNKVKSDTDIKNESTDIKDESVNILSDTERRYAWTEKTLCVMGDSIIGGLEERRLGRNGIKVKVRCFPGCTISDMNDYCKPILKKKPSHIVLHVGTNDTNKFCSREIIDKLLSLKNYIQSELPNCKIALSTPTCRYDDAKSGLTVKHVCDHMKALGLDIVDNGNITGIHLGKRGLHLNGKGTGRLAMNIISYMQGL